MLQKIALSLAAGIAALWLAQEFIPNVTFTGNLERLLIIGGILGIINLTVKPVLNIITLPIRILTLGFSTVFIQIILLWALDRVFPELEIAGAIALAATALLVGALSLATSLLKKEPSS